MMTHRSFYITPTPKLMLLSIFNNNIRIIISSIRILIPKKIMINNLKMEITLIKTHNLSIAKKLSTKNRLITLLESIITLIITNKKNIIKPIKNNKQIASNRFPHNS